MFHSPTRLAKALLILSQVGWAMPTLPLSLWPVAGLAIHQGGEVLSLDAAVRQALAGNPGLAEVRARAEAMAAIPDQAGSPPDPVLSVEMLNLPVNSFDFRRDDMSMVDLGLSQTVPFPGKLDLQSQIAASEAAAAAQTAEEARLRLARDVKLLWWQLFYLERTLQLVADTERILRGLVEAVQVRYRVGEAEQQEVLQAQLALSRLGEERLVHSAMHHAESARLNALLDRPGTGMIFLPHEAPGELPEVAPEDKLDETAEQARPLLAQKKHAIDAAQRRVELAEREFYPDVTVSAGYAFRDRAPDGERRSDFLRFGVSVNLPVYAASKQARAVDQRHSELLKENHALQDARREMQGDIAAALADYRRAKAHHALLTQEIIPLSSQTVASLAATYRAGKTGLAELLRARVALRNDEMQAWLAYAQAQQALAKLAAAAGREKL